jgi:type II secretory pathway pseudopilin PulG
VNQRGFTYIETIAAVTLLGLSIMIASSLTAAYPVASAHLVAQEEMLASLDAVLEGVRAGAIPAESGSVSSPVPTSSRISVRLEVVEHDSGGLKKIRAVASTVVRGRVLSRELWTTLRSQE